MHGCSGGGVHGCSWGACMVARGHAWLLQGGHAWLLRGGDMRGCSRGVRGSSGGGACVVFSMRYGQ